MSKLSADLLKRSLAEINAPDKARKFTETLELQVGLKDYDPQKDKRFSGTIRLPHVPRPNLKVIVLGDQVHCDEAQALGVAFIDQDSLKKFNKQWKAIKKYFKPYSILLGSDTIVKNIPRLLGPALSKMNKFPISLSHSDNLQEKINEAKATIKFQLKKVLCMGVAVGNLGMSQDEQRQNVTLAANFLCSLLKKNWNNIRSLHIKSTMGKPKRIYG